jgi:hypothetical protein
MDCHTSVRGLDYCVLYPRGDASKQGGAAASVPVLGGGLGVIRPGLSSPSDRFSGLSLDIPRCVSRCFSWPLPVCWLVSRLSGLKKSLVSPPITAMTSLPHRSHESMARPGRCPLCRFGIRSFPQCERLRCQGLVTPAFADEPHRHIHPAQSTIRPNRAAI